MKFKKEQELKVRILKLYQILQRKHHEVKIIQDSVIKKCARAFIISIATNTTSTIYCFQCKVTCFMHQDAQNQSLNNFLIKKKAKSFYESIELAPLIPCFCSAGRAGESHQFPQMQMQKLTFASLPTMLHCLYLMHHFCQHVYP